ncbi:MAG: rod shape-determining protein MreC [Phycisphaerales bacterium]|nr:MAG: rod shape-determining protein MreC [Phycisphaerales bacterium]
MTGVESVARVVQGGGGEVSRASYEALAREKAALEHQVAALTVRVEQLEEEAGILAATRLWEVDGQRIGTEGRLIPARVITADLLPWRSSRLINAGSLQGVRRGSAVVSRYFAIDRGEADGVRDGMAILLREVFVGLIDEQTGTHTSRVKLLSDVSVEMKVRIGRFTDAGFTALDRHFWLMGRGGGVMEIRDVQRRDVDDGVVKIGDVVLSALVSGLLPVAMTVGEVVDIKPDRDNPLLAILTIKSSVDEDSLHRVYVYDPGSHSDENVNVGSLP